MGKLKDYIKLARPKHWIKNFLIFIPSLFDASIFNRETLAPLCIGFVSFCLIASSIYYINDIKDVEKDRLHEIKKKRPIASGRISVRSAVVVMAAMVLGAFIILFSCFHGMVFRKMAFTLLIYFIINILYSLGLKDRPIIDVIILAAGFVLRVIFGSAASHVPISQWLLLTILMFSLYMGLGKRRNELRKISDSSTRRVLKYYSDEYLSRVMLLTMTLGLVFYSLWASIIVEQGNIMVWTIPLVIAIIMKYELDVDKDNFGDPVEVLTHDKPIFLMLTVYVGVVLFVLYK